MNKRNKLVPECDASCCCCNHISSLLEKNPNFFSREDDIDAGFIRADEFLADWRKDPKRIGKTIRIFRNNHEYTQQKAAQLIGIPIKHLVEMEQSKRQVDKVTARKMAKVFGTSYEMFL